MANSTSHVLPYPIRKARYSLPVTFRVSAGTPTDPTTPDTEFSTDGGATFSDCAEEITTGGTNGAGYLTLTGAETDNNFLHIAGKSANCLTTPIVVQPRNLAIVGSGTLSAGSAGGGTLGTLLAYDVTGCFIRTTGGTGGGGTGGANNQARRIITYNTSTGAFTVSPNWETTPSTDTTYDVLLPEGVTLGMLKALNPATAGRTLVVDSAGLADANTVKLGPSGSGTAQTARDIGASVLLSSGTGTGQLDFTSGVLNQVKLANAAMGGSSLALSLGSLSNAGTTTLTGAVTATNASNDLRGILLQATQTGVTIPTVTTVGTVNALAADSVNSSALAASAVTEIWAGSTAPTAAAIADAVWDEDATAHQTQGTFGQAIGDPGGVDSDTIWNSLNTIYDNAYDGITARILANTTHVNGTLASTILTTPVADIKTKTDQLTFTVANVVDSNTTQWKGSTAPAMTGDAYARLGAPVGASISADIAGVPAALLGLSNGIETGVTLKQAIRAIAAACAGKRSNSGTTSEQFDAIGNAGTARIVGNMDGNGDGTPTLSL